MYPVVIRTIRTDGIQIEIIKGIIHLNNTRWTRDKDTFDEKSVQWFLVLQYTYDKSRRRPDIDNETQVVKHHHSTQNSDDQVKLPKT